MSKSKSECITAHRKCYQLWRRMECSRNSRYCGQIKIDFFSLEDLRTILNLINTAAEGQPAADLLERHIAQAEAEKAENPEELDDRSKEEKEKDDADLYNIQNFSV